MNKEPYRPNQQHIAASSDTQIVPSKPKLTDKSNLKCYRCGGLGHIVPNCPHPAQPRAAAAQITSEHDDDDDPTLGESFEGEQYDPELYSEENMEAHEIDHNQPESGQDHSYIGTATILLMGDPDPNPWVFSTSESKPRSGRVSATG